MANRSLLLEREAGSSIEGARSLEQSNLIFIKVQKCSSSTFAGIVRSIAAHRGLWGAHSSFWLYVASRVPSLQPGIWANHGSLQSLQPSLEKLTQPYMLWTFLRQPGSRCMSKFYHFRVSRGGKESSVENKLTTLKWCRNKLYTATRSHNDESAESVIKRYDFIGLTERFDESLIALRHKYGLALKDIAYMPSKSSRLNKRDYQGYKMLEHPPLSQEPAEVRRFINSKVFLRQNKMDLELWNRANASLDRALASIHGWREELRLLRELVNHAARRCSYRPCRFKDNGCGYPCLDALASRMQSKMWVS